MQFNLPCSSALPRPNFFWAHVHAYRCLRSCAHAHVPVLICFVHSQRCTRQQFGRERAALTLRAQDTSGSERTPQGRRNCRATPTDCSICRRRERFSFDINDSTPGSSLTPITRQSTFCANMHNNKCQDVQREHAQTNASLLACHERHVHTRLGHDVLAHTSVLI